VSDWRPFEIRRPIGGDVVRADSGWTGALRYGTKDYPFDIVVGTTLTGFPRDYTSTQLSLSVPASVPNRGEMVLVRAGFGYPTTPLDGVAIWYHPDSGPGTNPTTDQFNQLVVDTPLTPGRWYYYTLFVKVVDQAYPIPGSGCRLSRSRFWCPTTTGTPTS
jgi:hypothetical protein